MILEHVGQLGIDIRNDDDDGRRQDWQGKELPETIASFDFHAEVRFAGRVRVVIAAAQCTITVEGILQINILVKKLKVSWNKSVLLTRTVLINPKTFNELNEIGLSALM